MVLISMTCVMLVEVFACELREQLRSCMSDPHKPALELSQKGFNHVLIASTTPSIAELTTDDSRQLRILKC